MRDAGKTDVRGSGDHGINTRLNKSGAFPATLVFCVWQPNTREQGLGRIRNTEPFVTRSTDRRSPTLPACIQLPGL